MSIIRKFRCNLFIDDLYNTIINKQMWQVITYFPIILNFMLFPLLVCGNMPNSFQNSYSLAVQCFKAHSRRVGLPSFPYQTVYAVFSHTAFRYSSSFSIQFYVKNTFSLCHLKNFGSGLS